MDTLILMMYGQETKVQKSKIIDIKNGKAFTTANRWFDIVCDQCETDYESVEEAGYIVCNICNKVNYVSDLRP